MANRCDPYRSGAPGVNCARQLSSHGVKTAVYIENSENVSLLQELSLYKITGNNLQQTGLKATEPKSQPLSHHQLEHHQNSVSQGHYHCLTVLTMADCISTIQHYQIKFFQPLASHINCDSDPNLSSHYIRMICQIKIQVIITVVRLIIQFIKKITTTLYGKINVKWIIQW